MTSSTEFEEDYEAIVVDILIPKQRQEMIRRIAEARNQPVEVVAKEYVRWKLLQS